MKKLIINIGLVIVLLALTSCSNSLRFQGINNEIEKDTSRNVETGTSSNGSEEKSIETGIIPNDQNTAVKPKDLNSESENTDNTYTINHEKDGSTYTVSVMHDSDYNYTLQLFDSESNKLQSILLGRIPEGIDFMDVNLDGYTDIIANTGGTLNETHELYIWDVSSRNFIKVTFEGFDMLSYFELHEGYIMNWVKDTATSGVIQKLIWNGNTLMMESEELYELNAQSKTASPSADTKTKIEYRENLCTNNEEVLFSFKLANSPKTLSVCLSKTQPDYIVYRFGTKDKVELEFPENKADSWSEFTYSYYLRGGGAENEGMDLNYLSFENGGYEYKVYQEFTAEDNTTKVGIKITDKATNKATDIKGLSDSIEGSLINLRENEKIKTEIL